VVVPLVAVVGMRDGLIDSEHIYWGQASVLAQVGLLDPTGLPVTGGCSRRQPWSPTRARSCSMPSSRNPKPTADKPSAGSRRSMEPGPAWQVKCVRTSAQLVAMARSQT
jgi:hypothetical protein